MQRQTCEHDRRKVEYRLTDLGLGLGAAFCGVWLWAEENIDRIKAKVMLIVGGQDKRVPPVQGESLHNALAKRGIDHEWLYQRTEGHTFYDEANVTDMFEKILAFLGRNIGTAAPSANPAAAPSAPAGN